MMWRTLARWTTRALLAVVLLALAVEAALWGASAWVEDRGGAWQPGTVRVLCVGDSHTYGAAVQRDEAYPHQLQQVLDKIAPGRFSVLNLGVPGMNTSQLRRRLPGWLSRYEPDVVVVWAGVNNAWNVADAEKPEGPAARLDQLALRSRVYRMVRTRLHDRELEHAGPTRVSVLDGSVQEQQRADPLQGTIQPEPSRRAKAPWSRAVSDYGQMARDARSMDARLLLLSYPLELGSYADANRVIHAAGRELRIETIRGPDVLGRVPEGEADWRWALHPGPPVYQEYAKTIARRLLRPRAR